MKAARTGFWIATGMLALMMLSSVAMYIFTYPEVANAFRAYGYPAYLPYILAVAKTLGILAIAIGRFPTLKEWAYAGFFFDFTLAAIAHWTAGDGGTAFPLLAMALLLTSYFLDRRASRENGLK